MLSSIRVLIAEDHSMMRDAIARLLSDQCIVAGTVERGDAVNAAIDELRPDALVMDISMPGQSGLQLLPELRSRYPQLAIVLLTNHVSDAYRQAAQKLGADGYVLKERARGELWAAVWAGVDARCSITPMQIAGP